MSDTSPPERSVDVTLFGATGFVGRLIAAYLAARAPRQIRLAFAGRDRERLEALRREVRREVEIVVADVDDPASLARMAAATRVLLTTVGPYARSGEPVVRACVEQGADYLDLTGEPGFVAAIRKAHDAQARERGVLVVPCCGFDSIPTDLGVLFTVLQLPRDRPISVAGYVEGRGGFSGGTLASALGAMAAPARASSSSSSAGPERARPRPRLHFQPTLRRWGAPMPTIDPEIARRSASLRGDYGPDFSYEHYAAMPSLPALGAATVAVGALALAARVPPARALLTRLRPPGSGPSAERRAKSWFKVSFIGRAGDVEVLTEVSGGDPGYDETARMAGETALCFALERDKFLLKGGVVTTAASAGEALLRRLQAAGLSFVVRERRGS